MKLGPCNTANFGRLLAGDRLSVDGGSDGVDLGGEKGGKPPKD